jgi:transposase
VRCADVDFDRPNHFGQSARDAGRRRRFSHGGAVDGGTPARGGVALGLIQQLKQVVQGGLREPRTIEQRVRLRRPAVAERLVSTVDEHVVRKVELVLCRLRFVDRLRDHRADTRIDTGFDALERPEFKDEAVKLVVNTGRPIATVARELGIVEQTQGNWVKADRQQANDGALSESERAELGRLRRENSRVNDGSGLPNKCVALLPQEALDMNGKRSS